MDTTKQQSWAVIKLGGSIVIPDLPDTEYIQGFRELIRKRVNLGEKFLIIVGGGKTSRNYQNVLRRLGDIPKESEHWIGIYSGFLNAQLVRLAFGDLAYGEVVVRPDALPKDVDNYSVIVCSGDAPGHSFNYDGAVFGHAVGAKKIINLSNIDYVYDADPRAHPDAQKYPEVGWEQYMTFIPQEHEPGGNSPFDIIASRFAHEHDMEVVFMKGNPIEHFQTYLETGDIQGSVISNRFA